MEEHLQGLEAKVNSLEHQQAQQQYINIDGLENSDARAIFMKLLTAIITFIHIGLYIVGTFLSLAKPFLRTKFRVSVTFLILLISFFVYRKMENLDDFFTYLTTNNHHNVSHEKIESNKSWHFFKKSSFTAKMMMALNETEKQNVVRLLLQTCDITSMNRFRDKHTNQKYFALRCFEKLTKISGI